MLPLDNVTTIYLTGFIGIGFALMQIVFFRKKGLPVYLWSAGYLLLSIGYITTLFNLVGPIAVLLGSLLILSSLGVWSGYAIPKKASLICLGGVVVTATLFHFSRIFGAPLGSLETILLAPVSAILIYSGWFTGVQAIKNHSKYILFISAVLWLQGIFMSLLTLGALAAKGDDYIIVTSEVVYWTSLINLAVLMVSNISWSLQISEDLLIKGGLVKVSNTNKSTSQEKTTEKTAPINKEDKSAKEKNNNKKSESVETIYVNPDLLSDAEKLSLLEKLTDKEREVFFLAAEGKKNGEIATILNSSEASVKVHRSRMVGKLGMKKSDELKKLMISTPAAIESKEVEVSLPKSDDAEDLFTKT
jgi:DNA-binding CsgD family transcriptional regulator